MRGEARAVRERRYPVVLMDSTITHRQQAFDVFSALQQQALLQGVAMREPPQEPDTCCGRGCNGCVWEGYFAAANYWREEALLLLS